MTLVLRAVEQGERLRAEFRRAALAALFALCLGVRARGQAPLREWNQPRGNAGGTAHMDVEPIRVQPVVAWKRALGAITCEPVSWGGVVYAVATDKGSRKLHALDLATGKSVAGPGTLPFKGELSIGVWQGTVTVLTGEGVLFFSRRGTEMGAREKRVEGSFPGSPSIASGLLFAGDASGMIRIVDIGAMRVCGEAGAGMGRPSVVLHDERPIGLAATLLETRAAGAGQMGIAFEQRLLRGLDSKSVRSRTLLSRSVDIVPASLRAEARKGFVTHFENFEQDENVWLAFAPRFGAKPGESATLLTLVGVAATPIVTSPAVTGDRVFGFSAAGELVSVAPDAKVFRVVPPGSPLPAGARTGPVTAARDVLYLGNWAVDLESGRVLWCDPELDPVTGLLPVGDGRVVCVMRGGELVCLTDALAVSATAANGPAARPLPPDSGDGVVLASGERIAGNVARLDGGRVRVTGADQRVREFDAADVALTVSGDDVLRTGREHAVYLAFSGAHRATWLDTLEKLFASWREIGAPAESQRLVAEAQLWDLAPDRAAAWSRSLTGKVAATAANADKQRARVAAEEDEARKRACAKFRGSSEWCEAHGLRLCASALLADASLLGADELHVRDRAAPLVPASFPGAASFERSLTWCFLTRAILPSAGAYVPPEDAAWKTARAAPWNRDAYAVRTDEVLLFTRERDPAVIGDCLRNADRTVRVLTALLPGAAARRSAARTPLDVRLHRSRADFLAEAGGDLPGIAGYYVPGENVSRFYVPRGERSRDPLDRDLACVLAHELTHHYIAARWLGEDAAPAKGDPEKPGFWIVEGFARFVEDQVVEMERRGERFDDDTVKSIDAASALQQQSALVPLAELLSMSQSKFVAASDEVVVEVQLRNTLARIGVTHASRLYEEAGSLVYFLVNEAGEERRARVFEYLRAWYAAAVPTESWKALGYETAEALEAEYTQFLTRIRAR